MPQAPEHTRAREKRTNTRRACDTCHKARQKCSFPGRNTSCKRCQVHGAICRSVRIDKRCALDINRIFVDVSQLQKECAHRRNVPVTSVQEGWNEDKLRKLSKEDVDLLNEYIYELERAIDVTDKPSWTLLASPDMVPNLRDAGSDHTPAASHKILVLDETVDALNWSAVEFGKADDVHDDALFTPFSPIWRASCVCNDDSKGHVLSAPMLPPRNESSSAGMACRLGFQNIGDVTTNVEYSSYSSRWNIPTSFNAMRSVHLAGRTSRGDVFVSPLLFNCNDENDATTLRTPVAAPILSSFRNEAAENISGGLGDVFTTSSFFDRGSLNDTTKYFDNLDV